MIVGQKKRKLGFLGLSFKAGTDDLRNSPAVAVIESLLGKGYDISIYDKNVRISHLTGTNKEYIDTHIPHLSRLMANDIAEIMDGSEVIIINTKEKEYAEALADYQGNAKIIDLVRIEKAAKNKAIYQGINW